MADDGRRMTDVEFRRLSAKIKAVYQEAYEDIYKKNLDFVKRHERKEAQYRQMVDEGKITQVDFDAWMRGQVFQGKQWEAKRKQMEATLLNADQMAMDMINGSRVRVFADNANFIGYELEQHGRVDTSFGLYDINSVKRLLMEEPDLLPPRSVGKDESYKWYNKQIQGAVTQGIIQGEKLTDIAKRIGQVTGERCMNAMLRNARTMHTGAECAGRIEGMHQAQRLGIEVQKKWLATLDGHTRDAHRDLDGQVRDVDKPFDSPMGKIRFPGDATAFPGLVWNCRCTLTYVYPKYPDSMTQRRDNITGEVIEDMTYREWERMKRGELPEQDEDVSGFTVVDGNDISMTWERRPDEFDFAINDVINAQGFDGVPRVVDDDEFERAVRESGFIAQRTYSAPDKDTLDAYRDQLYNGEWYVDCSTGGAQYGQGMYCAADYSGKLSDGIQAEMAHYKSLYSVELTHSEAENKAKEIELQRLITGSNLEKDDQKYLSMYDYYTGRWKSEYIDEIKAIRSENREKYNLLFAEAKNVEAKYDAAVNTISRMGTEKIGAKYGFETIIQNPSYTETITLDRTAKIIKYDDLVNMRTEKRRDYVMHEIDEQLTDVLSRAGIEVNENTKKYARFVADPTDFTVEEEDKYQSMVDMKQSTAIQSAILGKPQIVNDLHFAIREADYTYLEKMADVGVFAASLGYDAINAEGHGESGSYTVILNRTKVIFRRP